ncbi:hypothetical protein C4568_00985 [Candidatus Parcubacteria bacterium]|nr:MAG: hypothetical protein C4568_00985 [Candidatus Parcubacteria bacterium]
MEKESPFRKTALAITRWIGSPESLFVHTVLFALGFIAVLFHIIAFEIMLLVLTTLVSLEAIYLSIFIQMSINFTTASIAEVEHDIDEIQEDVGEIQEDVEELQEDVEEMSEEDAAEEQEEEKQQRTLAQIQIDLKKLIDDISKLQQK